MAWIEVNQITSAGSVVANMVNIDSVVRVGENKNGCFLRLLDGSSIEVTDSYEEIKNEFVRLAAKELK